MGLSVWSQQGPGQRPQLGSFHWKMKGWLLSCQLNQGFLSLSPVLAMQETCLQALTGEAGAPRLYPGTDQATEGLGCWLEEGPA